MFALLKNPQFKTTARIIVPTEDGDVEQTLDVRFRLMTDDDTALQATQFLRQAVVSLGDIVDDAGQPMPYTEGLRDRMITIPFVRLGLVRAYWAAVSKAKLGN